MSYIELCKQNGYVARLALLEKNEGISITFPSDVISGHFTPDTKHVYYIKGNRLQVYHDVKLQLDVEVPSYVIRPLIISDIALKLADLSMSNDLVVYEDGVEANNLNDLLKHVDIDNTDYIKELELNKLIGLILMNKPCAHEAEKREVTEGYNVLVNYLEAIGGID